MAGDFSKPIVGARSGEAIYVIDNHAFRRKALTEILFHWAERKQISVIEVDNAEALWTQINIESAISKGVAFILSIGGMSVSDSSVLKAIIEIRRLSNSNPLIIIADKVGDVEVRFATEIGASGIIPTTMSASQVFSTFEFILNGGTFFPNGRSSWQPRPAALAERSLKDETAQGGFARPAMPQKEVVQFRHAAQPGEPAEQVPERPARPDWIEAKPLCNRVLDDLTQRQAEVLRALSPGLSNKEIARELNLSDATVKIHIRNLMKKLGVQNRTQLALIGAGLGPLPPDDTE